MSRLKVCKNWQNPIFMSLKVGIAIWSKSLTNNPFKKFNEFETLIYYNRKHFYNRKFTSNMTQWNLHGFQIVTTNFSLFVTSWVASSEPTWGWGNLEVPKLKVLMWTKGMSYVLSYIVRVLPFCALLHGDVTITFLVVCLWRKVMVASIGITIITSLLYLVCV